MYGMLPVLIDRTETIDGSTAGMLPVPMDFHPIFDGRHHGGHAGSVIGRHAAGPDRQHLISQVGDVLPFPCWFDGCPHSRPHGCLAGQIRGRHALGPNAGPALLAGAVAGMPTHFPTSSSLPTPTVVRVRLLECARTTSGEPAPAAAAVMPPSSHSAGWRDDDERRVSAGHGSSGTTERRSERNDGGGSEPTYSDVRHGGQCEDGDDRGDGNGPEAVVINEDGGGVATTATTDEAVTATTDQKRHGVKCRASFNYGDYGADGKDRALGDTAEAPTTAVAPRATNTETAATTAPRTAPNAAPPVSPPASRDQGTPAPRADAVLDDGHHAVAPSMRKKATATTRARNASPTHLETQTTTRTGAPSPTRTMKTTPAPRGDAEPATKRTKTSAKSPTAMEATSRPVTKTKTTSKGSTRTKTANGSTVMTTESAPTTKYATNSTVTMATGVDNMDGDEETALVDAYTLRLSDDEQATAQQRSMFVKRLLTDGKSGSMTVANEYGLATVETPNGWRVVLPPTMWSAVFKEMHGRSGATVRGVPRAVDGRSSGVSWQGNRGVSAAPTSSPNQPRALQTSTSRAGGALSPLMEGLRGDVHARRKTSRLEPLAPNELLRRTEVTEAGELPAYHANLLKATERSHECTEQARRREQERQARYYNRKTRNKRQFQVGDLVWMHNPPRGKNATKFVHQWMGPPRIVEPAGYDNFVLTREDKTRKAETLIAHVSFHISYHYPEALLAQVARDIDEQLDYEDQRPTRDEPETASAVRSAKAPARRTTSDGGTKRMRAAVDDAVVHDATRGLVVERRRRRQRNGAGRYVLEYELCPYCDPSRWTTCDRGLWLDDGHARARWASVAEYERHYRDARVVEDPGDEEAV
ncbi:hypothetical protein ON010_g9601 [Phytophthora cinnamomi]|nr:hypothetical protein ON010_g9601 [Phytophthora cinnamomi]